VPISSVRIVAVSETGNDIAIDNGNDVRVTLTQGRMDGVACIVVVDGTANAPPEVEITMSDVNGTNDETDAFERNSTSVPVNSVTTPGGGPAHYQTVVRLAYVTDEPEVNFNRMKMRCTAVQSGFPKVVTSVQLDVRCKINKLCLERNVINVIKFMLFIEQTHDTTALRYFMTIYSVHRRTINFMEILHDNNITWLQNS